MRAVVQRVTQASVTVNNSIVGTIGLGLLVLLGIGKCDTSTSADYMIDKLLGLRIFEDHDSKMNFNVREVGGAVLVVPQFTLYGDAGKGRRPSFIAAAPPEIAIPLYERFVALLREHGARSNIAVETGEFGAMMDVELVNDGPVTLILEK